VANAKISHNGALIHTVKPSLWKAAPNVFNFQVDGVNVEVKVLRRPEGERYRYELFLDGISFQQHTTSVFDLVTMGEFAFQQLVTGTVQKADDGLERSRTLSRNLQDVTPSSKQTLKLDRQTLQLDISHSGRKLDLSQPGKQMKESQQTPNSKIGSQQSPNQRASPSNDSPFKFPSKDAHSSISELHAEEHSKRGSQTDSLILIESDK